MSAEIEALLIKARQCIDNLDFDDAQDQITSALKINETYAPAYELLGEIYVEQELQDDARTAFTKAIQCDKPNDDSMVGFEKYLWMGQLCTEDGEQAIKYYKTGVKRLISVIARTDESDQYSMRVRLASAYSAMAELYMTDLCMNDGAEQQCEKYVTNALLADGDSPEALQTLASMRLSQSRIEDAKRTLTNSMSVWKGQIPGSSNFPSYTSRLSLVRLLLECEMMDEALEVLHQLEQEDDQVVDLWFLLGWTYFLQGERFGNSQKEKHRESWEDARDCLHKCEVLYKRFDCDDESLKEHASNLLANINAAGISIEHKEAGPEMLPEDEEGDDEEWESDENEMDED